MLLPAYAVFIGKPALLMVRLGISARAIGCTQQNVYNLRIAAVAGPEGDAYLFSLCASCVFCGGTECVPTGHFKCESGSIHSISTCDLQLVQALGRCYC